jgi:bifunctional aspartokinase / homoserine dehydrogenase 1
MATTILKVSGRVLSTHEDVRIVAKLIAEEDHPYVVVSAPGEIPNVERNMTDVLLHCAQHRIDCTQEGPLYELRTGKYFALSPLTRFTSFARALLSESACTAYLDKLRADLADAAARSSLQYPDPLVSIGEQGMAELLSWLLYDMGCAYPVVDPCTFLCSDGKDGIDIERSTRLLNTEAFRTKALPRFIVPGYYARGENGKLVCLPRHGSNITAVALARILMVYLIHNLSHLAGIPVLPDSVSDGSPNISVISHDELAELMRPAPTELNPIAIRMMKGKQGSPHIDLRIRRPSDDPSTGTLVTFDDDVRAQGATISGMGLVDTYTILSGVSDEIDIPGIIASIGKIFGDLGVNVPYYSGTPTGFSYLFSAEDGTCEIVERIFRKRFPNATLSLVPCAVVCVVGRNLKSEAGIASRFFGALHTAGVNVLCPLNGDNRMLAAAIDPDDIKRATAVLAYEFFDLSNKSLMARK